MRRVYGLPFRSWPCSVNARKREITRSDSHLDVKAAILSYEAYPETRAELLGYSTVIACYSKMSVSYTGKLDRVMLASRTDKVRQVVYAAEGT